MILFMWLGMKVVISLGDSKKNMVLHQVNTEKAQIRILFRKNSPFKFNEIVYIRNRKN